MKKIIKLTFITAIMLLTFSCEKDYLEEEPSEFITTDQIADAASRNPDVIAGTMKGIYALMFETGTGGTTGHDDFGQKGYDIFSDMLSSDMALSLSTYGWYRASITEYQCTQDFTYTDNYQVWRYYYRIIRSANTVIDALGGNDAIPDLDENKYIMGQAKVMRAHSYFYLTQYFQKSYDPSEPILPLYDDLLDQNGPKVAASEIYAFIESDLLEAITLLDGYIRSAKVEVDQNIAKAILAYFYGANGGKDLEVKTSKGRLTQSIALGGNVMSKQVFNGETGFAVTQGQKTAYTDEQIAAAKADANPFPELAAEDAKVMGIEPIEGKDAYVVALTEAKTAYYDVESGLKVKSVNKIAQGDQTMEVPTSYSNYQEVEGIKFPFTITQSFGPQTFEFNVSSIKVNEGVSDEDFME